MVHRLLRFLGMAHFVLGVLVATVVLTGPDLRRYGDRMQVALPALAWTCAVTQGGGIEFALRYLSANLVVRSSKHVLGELAVNERPNGSAGGFPSGHMTAAAIGASALVNDCLRGNLVAQLIVLVAAGMVGVSRIVVGAHFAGQVLAGAMLGWVFDRAFRKGPTRAALAARAVRGQALIRALPGWQRAVLLLAAVALLLAVGRLALSAP